MKEKVIWKKYAPLRIFHKKIIIVNISITQSKKHMSKISFFSGFTYVCKPTKKWFYTLITLVLPAHKFVFPRTQHFCHIWKTHVCVDLTQVVVLEMTTQVLCDTCSNTPKNVLPPARVELTISCITGECSIDWATTDTSHDSTIVIFTVTLTIKHTMAKLQYINTCMHK